MKILWIENDVKEIETYVEALRHNKIEVEICPTADDAFEIFSSGECDFSLVVLDLVLPPGDHFTLEETEQGGRTGLSLLRMMRSRSESLSTLPVFLMTKVRDFRLRDDIARPDITKIIHKINIGPREFVKLVKSSRNSLRATKRITLDQLLKPRHADPPIKRENRLWESKNKNNKREFQPSDRNRFTTVFAVALDHEFVMARAILEAQEEIHMATPLGSIRFVGGRIQSNHGGRHEIALVPLFDMGNTNAAARMTQFLTDFPMVQQVLLIGIAGGIPNPHKPADHVRLGDVVIATQTIQFDYGKRYPTDFEVKAPPRPTARSFVDAAKWLVQSGQEVWVRYVAELAANEKIRRPRMSDDKLYSLSGTRIRHPLDDSRDKKSPRVHVGPIGTSNAVLKDAKARDDLANKYGILAVEMEGAGIAEAAFTLNRSYGVIRGITDYCDVFKNDRWRKYAAMAAAGVSRAVLEEMTPITRNNTRTSRGSIIR